MSTELRGSPRQPWVERFNLTVQPLCAASDWLTLVSDGLCSAAGGDAATQRSYAARTTSQVAGKV